MNYCQINPRGEFPQVPRIIAVGDIHGDYSAIIAILYHAKIINSKLQWIAKDTHLVQVGDILDRGGRAMGTGDEMSEYNILKLLFKLKKDAKMYNSDVHIILGNHEIMNILGVFSYVSELGMKDFDGHRRAYFKPGGKIAKLMACNTITVLKIGKWLFSHAGILPEISKHNSIPEINNIIREFILGNTETPGTDIIHKLFWHRQYANYPKCKKVAKTNKKYGTLAQVNGHNVQRNGINSTCDDALWRIDIGMSKAFGLKQQLQYLEILNDKYVNIITI